MVFINDVDKKTVFLWCPAFCWLWEQEQWHTPRRFYSLFCFSVSFFPGLGLSNFSMPGGMIAVCGLTVCDRWTCSLLQSAQRFPRWPGCRTQWKADTMIPAWADFPLPPSKLDMSPAGYDFVCRSISDVCFYFCFRVTAFPQSSSPVPP